MGNSNSSQINHTRSHQPYHPAFHQEIRKGQLQYPPGSHTHLDPSIYNPEFKVLPERIPGQKLRITDNGNILQNGGTISGKSPVTITPLPSEAEYFRVLQERKTKLDGQNTKIEKNKSRYYSNPDLVQTKYLFDSGHETSSSSNRRFQKKSKAPAPPPPAYPPASEPGVSRANSFKDPVTGTVIKIHPWEQRQETWCIGVPSHMRPAGSMERILEHRDTRHELSNTSISNQEWKFYKYQELKEKNGGRMTPNDRADKFRYAGSIDRQLNEKRFRAKSMDSLQTALSAERPLNPKLRQSLENLNNCIMEQNKLDVHQRLRRSQENLQGKTFDEIRRPSSRQSARSSSSLQRQVLPRKYPEDKWGYPTDLKLFTERSSSTSTGRMGSPVTKTEMLLHRKDSYPSPKQYYFGDGDANREHYSPVDRQEKEHMIVHRNASGPTPNRVQKLEARNSGSRHSEGTQSPLSQPDFPVKKITTPIQPENRNVNLTSGEERLNHRDTHSKNLAQTRQRNSYAFEDKRYRYEVDTPQFNQRNTLERHSESGDEEDISMNLRPTLPKRVPALPRFSPTQAWRSLNLEHITHAQTETSMAIEGDVHEDSIRRVTRPVAPPRVGNERSADSGISQDAGSPGLANDFDIVASQEKPTHRVKSDSPPSSFHLLNQKPSTAVGSELLPLNKRTTWTPEEDLTSDFDGASNEHPVVVNGLVPQMISVQPKLMSIKNMFSYKASPTNTEDEKRGLRGAKKMNGKANESSNTSHTYTSVRKLKRSSSGVLATPQENNDGNWSFSRSLPNSLHNGDEGDKEKNNEEKNSVNAMQRISSGPIQYSSLQSGLRNRVMSLDSLNLNNYSKSLTLQTNGVKDDSLTKYSPSQHIIYLPEYDAKKIILGDGTTEKETRGNIVYVGYDSKKPKKFTFQSTVRQQQRRKLEQKLSELAEHSEKQREREKLLVNKVEEEFQKKREREKATICHQLKMLSDPEPTVETRNFGIVGSESPPPVLMTASQVYLSKEYPKSQQTSDSLVERNKSEKQESGFLGGISKWMRRQQKLEEHHKSSRQEPEGAPSPSVQHDGTSKSGFHDQSKIIIASRYPNANLDTEGGNTVFIKMASPVEKDFTPFASSNYGLEVDTHQLGNGRMKSNFKNSFEDSDLSSEFDDNERRGYIGSNRVLQGISNEANGDPRNLKAELSRQKEKHVAEKKVSR